MAQKLKYEPNPTFKFDVQIPVAGQDEPGELTMTFRHLQPKQWSDVYAKSQESMVAAAEDGDSEKQVGFMAAAIMEIAAGWAWEQEFNLEHVSATLKNYPAFYASVMQQYGEELWKVRAKS
ncbi:TPA: hypothetical protein JHK28_000146 [Enterobacter cloacae]|nr:hypothetical protein [Enterobacter cloacae]